MTTLDPSMDPSIDPAIDPSTAFHGFATADLAAARTFYADVLGVEVTEVNGMLRLHVGGGTPTLVYPKPDHEPAGFTVLNFPVADIEAAVDDLVAKGVSMTHYDFTDERGINRRGGPLIAWFTDPSGNVLSVLQEG